MNKRRLVHYIKKLEFNFNHVEKVKRIKLKWNLKRKFNWTVSSALFLLFSLVLNDGNLL